MKWVKQTFGVDASAATQPAVMPAIKTVSNTVSLGTTSSDNGNARITAAQGSAIMMA
jgi:hypothetical protein